ncbi:hypothetical protein BHE74_00045394 [Ensete ventricosum]|nr:hypothetical protein BHE74_00045394 [Ensete ventricosum]
MGKRNIFSLCGEKKRLLPMRGEETSSPREAPRRLWTTDRDQESNVGSTGSPFSSPSSSLPTLIPFEIGRRRSKSTVTTPQRSATIEIDHYRPTAAGVDRN